MKVPFSIGIQERGQRKHVNMRTRQRKTPVREGKTEFRNRFAELQNEEGAQHTVTDVGKARKKRRVASFTGRGEE